MRWYHTSLARWPYRTQALTAGLLFGTGDAIAQKWIEGKGRYEIARTGRLFVYATLIFTPIHFQWQALAMKYITFPGPAYKTVLTRVAVEQSLITPPIVAIFFGSQALMEGKGWEVAKLRVEEKWWPTQIKSWSVWIPVQLFNFAVVPHMLRVPFASVVAVFWQAYMSVLNARPSQNAPRLETPLLLKKLDQLE